MFFIHIKVFKALKFKAIQNFNQLVNVPSNVTKIEEQAYAYCEKLQKIDFQKKFKT